MLAEGKERKRDTFSFLKSSTLSNWFKALDCSPLHSSSLLRRYGEICERQSHEWFENEKETKPKERINVTMQGMKLSTQGKDRQDSKTGKIKAFYELRVAPPLTSEKLSGILHFSKNHPTFISNPCCYVGSILFWTGPFSTRSTIYKNTATMTSSSQSNIDLLVQILSPQQNISQDVNVMRNPHVPLSPCHLPPVSLEEKRSPTLQKAHLDALKRQPPFFSHTRKTTLHREMALLNITSCCLLQFPVEPSREEGTPAS